jgi:serine/threonine-protein phosphatase 2A regulatory subunit A
MSVDFNALEFFKEEIMNDKAAIRIEAVSNMRLIASALGPEKTVSELVPLLVQAIGEDAFKNDEEFLCKVASGLGELRNFMPGDKLDNLIPPLEVLCAQEETVIRTSAVDSLCSIVRQRPGLVEQLLRCLHRLATKSDFFTARVSACSLFSTAYEFANDEEEKAKLRTAFVTICQDETPMVRRAAAMSMTDLAKTFVVIQQPFPKELLDAYKTLSQEDTQDSIRVSCMMTTIELAKTVGAAHNELLTVIKEASTDRSWRVRLTVAKSFPELVKAFGPALVSDHLLSCQQQFLQDQEFEVRKDTLISIEKAINLLDPDQLNQLLTPDQLRKLSTDSMPQVRAEFAKILGPLASRSALDHTKNILMPFFSEFLRDDNHDVRLQAVAHAGLICEKVGCENMLPVFNTIMGLKIDNHWRIREALMEQVPKFANAFGKDLYAEKLEALITSSLIDSCWKVRQATIDTVAGIAAMFGEQWSASILLPPILKMYAPDRYANRITVLKTFPKICQAMPDENAQQSLLNKFFIPIVEKALKDSIPNVRYCACETIEKYLKICHAGFSSLGITLEELAQDTDGDVQHLSQRVLRELEKQGKL